MPLLRTACAWLLPLACLLGLGTLQSWAGEDPLEEVKSLLELAQSLLDAGSELEDEKRMAKGREKLAEARSKIVAMQAKPGLTAAQKNRLERYLVDIDARIEWYAKDDGGSEGGADSSSAEDDAPKLDPEVRAPKQKKGERIGAWCKRVMAVYAKTDSPAGRASLARELGWKGGVIALPTLYGLFDKEDDETAREGIREGLVRVGTSRVAKRMALYAKKGKEARRPDALEVIYACLKRPERFEPERPYMKAIRAFHKLKNRKLTLAILTRLDRMGTPGIAALGEVIYVPDFGYHDHTISLLSNKQDTRAVPPLVHKMNRFKFEYRVQMPAHKALLKMGWYAVPELINRLDNKAAGIWISWTLRKITGETMGTDKRKWSYWWMREKIRHPELFDDPDERPAVVTGK